MRILLQSLEDNPAAGGGYTISQDVLNGLLEVGPGSAHEFFFLTAAAPSDQERPLPARFTRLRVPSVNRAFIERCSNAAKWRLAEYLPAVRAAQEAEQGRFLQQFLQASQVDCAYNITPWTSSPHLPNVTTVWDLEHRHQPLFPEVSAGGEWENREKLYWATLPKALAIITGTPTNQRQVSHFYGVDAANIRIIPYPTPAFALEPARVSAADLPPGLAGEFLFYPAQFWSHKNHVRLLAALKILQEQRGWRGHLVFCGSDKGNLAHVKQRAEDLGVGAQVHFLGFVERPRLLALYRHALALTFLSYFGPGNLPPLEAFALGCPVIASAVDGAEEFSHSAALHVNPDDSGAIAAAIWRLKTEPGLREDLIARGQKRAALCTTKSYATKLIGLFDDLEARFACFRK